MVQFSDGVSFDTNTALHVEKRKDGYYVVGNGMLMPVDSYDEGMAEISIMRKDAADAEETDAHAYKWTRP